MCDGTKVNKADGDGKIWVKWIDWIERLVEEAYGCHVSINSISIICDVVLTRDNSRHKQCCLMLLLQTLAISYYREVNHKQYTGTLISCNMHLAT